MYRPVNRSKASGGSGEYVTHGGGIPPPCARAMKLAMTVTVKAMATQRCVCRIHLFQFNGTSSEDAVRSGSGKLLRGRSYHQWSVHQHDGPPGRNVTDAHLSGSLTNSGSRRAPPHRRCPVLAIFLTARSGQRLRSQASPDDQRRRPNQQRMRVVRVGILRSLGLTP